MRLSIPLMCLVATLSLSGPLDRLAAEDSASSDAAVEAAMLRQLDAPLLFVKRHSYTGIHIYDTFYKWPPGGGGIYVLENPAAPQSQWIIRPVIDPTTPETLGVGVYSDPELWWDATKLLFCFKGEPNGSTSIYEIGIDGSGLRRVTDPTPTCVDYRGSLNGQHDVTPAYLPDGRIAFLSTRPSGLVPCNNTGVAILHVMNADGTDLHSISVNNVNEFDPCPLPDGRLLLGRWEYVDKNALTIQSLWTMNPDGTQETALFANNMVFPEAILDARPVPGSPLIVGTFAKHNSTPRGSIAMIDPRRGKNSVEAICNFEHPDNPTFDQGDSCEPWPLSEDLVLYSGRPSGSSRNVLQMIDRAGHRLVLLADPEICLHSPMLVKPQPRPPVIADSVDRTVRSGRFFVQDIYQGLTGVQRGEVKWLRVIEETSRISERTDGPNPYNQTFLLSSALAFSVKSYLGIVPVHEDGSAYFEVPSGRAVYLQALDQDGRLIQSMRTFVQAAPGTTRSCIGCHEHKYTATKATDVFPSILRNAPSQLEPESWGTGFMDYASLVQPILNRRCVRCHGGEEGIAAGMDLSGGWTEHFNISYENLTNRCRTQLIAHWIAGIDCMNGTALWSAQIFPPRSHGSGAAPLAELLISGHDGQISDMTRQERDVLMAWIDSNGLYYGTWNRTASGCALPQWNATKSALAAEMQRAGCLECHGQNGQPSYFENDWVNLENPQWSRILRAPLATGGAGLGLAWCRDRQVTADRQRVHLLRNGYAHAVQPPDAFTRHELVQPDRSGQPVVRFASTADPHYQAMLAIIHEAREAALAVPRVDMPGAVILPGSCRLLLPPELPESQLQLTARVDLEGAVSLQWDNSAQWLGLEFELHRGDAPGFELNSETLVARTPLSFHVDWEAPAGPQHYAVRAVSAMQVGAVTYASIDVPLPGPPAPPLDLRVVANAGAVRLKWHAPPGHVAGYHVYRATTGAESFARLTQQPLLQAAYTDFQVETGMQYRYVVRSLSRRNVESEPSAPVEAAPHLIVEPVFDAPLLQNLQANLYPGQSTTGQPHGQATLVDGAALDLSQGGHVTFAHDTRFELAQPFTISCRVKLDAPGTMPVVVSCGAWGQAGWFLQVLGGRWRWYVAGINCDGGTPPTGSWLHVVATFDGENARLFENGRLVAQQPGACNTSVWPGEMFVGQYSGQPAPEYQVHGQVKDLKIYHRILSEAEIQQAAATAVER